VAYIKSAARGRSRFPDFGVSSPFTVGAGGGVGLDTWVDDINATGGVGGTGTTGDGFSTKNGVRDGVVVAATIAGLRERER